MDDPCAAEHADLKGPLDADESLEWMLGHVADVVVRTIPACDTAGITLFQNSQVAPASPSAPLVRRVDVQHQYDAKEDPSRDGVSCLSLPLVIGDDGIRGVLNLYSHHGPFEQADADLGSRFTPLVSVAVEHALAYAKAREEIGQLQEGIEFRDVIGQAKGIIEARERCGPDDAFERLRTLSQHRNIKVRDLAAAIIESPDEHLIDPAAS